MQLEREVPRHKKTVKFSNCRKDIFVYDETFVRIRSGMKNKLDKCFWCNRPFKLGDQMALAIPLEGRNKVLCDACATELINSEPKIER